MNVLITLRFLLFAISIFGCFASFAQNDYGLTLVIGSTLLLALGILIGLFLKQRTMWGLAVLLAGLAFKFGWYPGANILLIIGGIVFPINCLMLFMAAYREQKSNRSILLFYSAFFLNILLAGMGITFSFLHWTGGDILVISALLLLLIILGYILFKRKFEMDEGKTPWYALPRIKGMPLFAFICLNYWLLVFTLQKSGGLPRFYSSYYPPSLQRLIEESPDGTSPEIEAYKKNYELFLEHRKASAESKNKPDTTSGGLQTSEPTRSPMDPFSGNDSSKADTFPNQQ